MARKPFFLLCLLICLGLFFSSAQATSFIAKDGAFTLDLPDGWKEVTSVYSPTVLSVKKGTSTVEIKAIDCTTETCLETKINNDLTQIKQKKMQVIGNAYTGEDIKRIEFSTGEPFFYISFYTPKSDFGAGYFLISGQGYSILARNLTYLETDLIFSFISPRTPEKNSVSAIPPLEMDVNDSRAYDIIAEPQVTEETVSAPVENSTQKTAEQSSWKQYANKLISSRINTFISKRMPPYVRQLGRSFDVLILVGIVYVLLLAVAFIVRLCKRGNLPLPAANPNSLYPIRFVRLYGTPSLIFRAKDNQGNILISLSSRWDSLFLLSGILLIVFTCVLLALTGIVERGQLLSFSPFVYDTVYSMCSLAIPLGLLIFFCGIVWSQLVLREISLFDRKGKKAAIVLQKGFGLTTEQYEIYFARSKEVLVAKRKRFSLRRNWQLMSQDGNVVAQIREHSAWKAIARKLLGHLWGFLRADYDIAGQMDSVGVITNAHALFNRFICQLDKPQAINARDLLVLSLLINIRDKDKWYPWFN